MHVTPQLMTAGLLVTVPVPSPDGVMVSCWAGTNVAVTLRWALIVTEQVRVVPHALPSPLQPEKSELASGVAVNVTVELSRKGRCTYRSCS